MLKGNLLCGYQQLGEANISDSIDDRGKLAVVVVLRCKDRRCRHFVRIFSEVVKSVQKHDDISILV